MTYSGLSVDNIKTLHCELSNHMLFIPFLCWKLNFCSDFAQVVLEVEDYTKAQPDAIARSSSKIISHLKAAGESEKTLQALKSLCWICKGIQVEVIHKLLTCCL